jgi:uncharacterized protein (DUF1778 family)
MRKTKTLKCKMQFYYGSPIRFSISCDIEKMSERTALLINCAETQARTIREQAELQRRSVSGYVLHIVMRAIGFERSLVARLPRRLKSIRSSASRPAAPRTTILVRCSVEEAKQIRTAAKRRDETISGFVLRTLARSWKATSGIAWPHN